MKHFIATHTCFSEEARRAFIENTKALTHKEMIEGTQTEKAKMVAHWMGKDEFFFCHWLADSEEAIHEALVKPLHHQPLYKYVSYTGPDKPLYTGRPRYKPRYFGWSSSAAAAASISGRMLTR